MDMETNKPKPDQTPTPQGPETLSEAEKLEALVKFNDLLYRLIESPKTKVKTENGYTEATGEEIVGELDGAIYSFVVGIKGGERDSCGSRLAMHRWPNGENRAQYLSLKVNGEYVLKSSYIPDVRRTPVNEFLDEEASPSYVADLQAMFERQGIIPEGNLDTNP